MSSYSTWRTRPTDRQSVAGQRGVSTHPRTSPHRRENPLKADTRVRIPLGLRRKPQVTSLITTTPANVVYEPIAPSSPVTALESAIAPGNEALRATQSPFRGGPGRGVRPDLTSSRRRHQLACPPPPSPGSRLSGPWRATPRPVATSDGRIPSRFPQVIVPTGVFVSFTECGCIVAMSLGSSTVYRNVVSNPGPGPGC